MSADYVTNYIYDDEPKTNNGITGEVPLYWDLFKTKIYKIKNYKDGILHGPYTAWYDNGNKYMEMNFVEGKIEVEYKEWNEDWSVSGRVDFKDGVINGLCTRYFFDGSGFMCMYKDDIRDGEYKEFDKNGVLIEHGFYENGKLDGPYKKLTKRGNYMTLYYKEGVRVKSTERKGRK